MMKKDDDSDGDKPSVKGEAKDDDMRNEAKAEPKPTLRPGDDAPLEPSGPSFVTAGGTECGCSAPTYGLWRRPSTSSLL